MTSDQIGAPGLASSSSWNNISLWVHRWAAIQPEKAAIVIGERVISWRGLEDRVAAAARLLHTLGVSSGDRVGCLMTNRPDFIVYFFAAARIGAIFVPYNVRLTSRELSFALEDSDPSIVVTEQSFKDLAASVKAGVPADRWLWVDGADRDGHLSRPLDVTPGLADLADTPPDLPVAVFYTSGTTGTPKGAILTHRNVRFMSLVWIIDLGLVRDDRHMVYLPLCFTGGLMSGVINPIQAGATIYLHDSFDPDAILRSIERHRATWMIGVPYTFQRFVECESFATVDIASLRRVLVGAAPAPKETIRLLQQRGIGVFHAFGMTEGSGGANLVLPIADSESRLGSMGRPTSNNAVRLVDENGEAVEDDGLVGELQFAGPLVFAGYWKRPEATAEAFSADGWLRTGDLAYRDADGFYFTAGRRTDMIVTGGLNVYAAEVEQVVATHPGVLEVAVTGLPDRRWQEVVTAFVIAREGHSLTLDSIAEHCRGELADYKIPKRLEIVQEFPRTVSGKVRKFELRPDGSD